MKHYHPLKDENGQPVELCRPSQPTGIPEWSVPSKTATTIPGAAMPDVVGEIAVETWMDAPHDDAGWEVLANASDFEEPPLQVKPGKKPASGAVVVEPDGRVWVVSPSNQFGGYINTFPKGTIYPGHKISLRANALKEVFEESGLKVKLTGFLADSDRSQTTTRYYLAQRIGGNPATMGWESQAVHLVPLSQLVKFVAHKNDLIVLQALAEKA